MAGYTRQSVADIINGANITAPPLNAEFNQLLAAFNASTGHTHDGSTGSAPKLPLTTSVSGYLPAIHGGFGGRNNNTATADPAATDDNTAGYAPGSIWINTSTGYTHLCLYNTTNNANWVTVAAISNTNIIAPKVNNTVTLGTSTLQFKDIHIDGVGYIDDINAVTMSSTGNVDVGGVLTVSSNTAIGGTLAVTGASTLTGNTVVLGSLGVTGGAIFSNTVNVLGDTTLGNATSDTVTFTGRVDSDVLPATDGTHDLGSTTQEWQDLWVDGTANIDALVADTADINAGTIDDATIGASTPTTIVGTTITGTAFVGPISGAVTGNVSGNVTGNLQGNSNGAHTGTVAGNVTGNLAGNVTSTGTNVLATVDIGAGSIDGTAIGAASASTVVGTTITATNFVGPIAGAVTGDVTGDVDGDLTGNVTGNVSGNITSTGASSFTDLTINGSLNMNSGTAATVTGLSAPVQGSDATTKTYVDSADALKLNLAGGTMSGAIAMGTSKITGLGTPTATADAATKGYVDQEVSDLVAAAPGALDTLNELAAALNDDASFHTTITNSIATKLPKAGGTMTGAIAMGTSKITGLGTPTAAADAVTKAYTDSADALKLNLTGGTLSGALAMGTSKITGLGAPTAGADATTKTYVDAGEALKVSKAGDTMSGVLAMGANKITGVANPTLAQDVVTKNYSDTLFGSTTAAATSASNAATSESNASTSETNSLNSANSSAASLATFVGQYVSQSGTPSSPGTGDLWFDTGAAIMKVYNGSGWVSAGSAVSGTNNSVQYTATANQTTYAAVYDAGYLQVYLNGIRLDAEDYTATNGSSVILDTGAAVDDVVFIHSFGTFLLADHYSKTVSDARFEPIDSAYTKSEADTKYAETASANTFASSQTFSAGVDVTGTVTTNGLTATSSTNGVRATIGKTGGANLNVYADTNTVYLAGDATLANAYIIDQANNNLQFKANAAERMRVDASGIDVTGTVTADAISTGTFTSTGIDDNASSTKLTIQSNGIGIGTASVGSGLGVYLNRGVMTNFFEASDGTKKMIVGTDPNNAFVKLGALNNYPASLISNNAQVLTAETNGDATVNTGNLVIGTSGKGIDFSANGNAGGMTSEVLDDYEEGTWQPAASLGTIAAVNAKYTKVGNKVTVWFVASSFSERSSSNYVSITGLPFVSNGYMGHGTVGSVMYQSISTATPNVYLNGGASYLNFYGNSSGGWSIMSYSHLSNPSSSIYGHAIYYTDS